MHIQFPLELKKKRPPRELIQVDIWKGRIDILDIDTELNSMLKAKWIQRLLNPFNTFWKDL